MSKAELSAQLEAMRATYNGPVILYAGNHPPERRRHKQRPTPKALAFAEVLEDGQRLLAAKIDLA